MSREALPTEISDFIQRHINSLEELEILLLFFAEPEARLDAETINTSIRSSTAAIAHRLIELSNRGFLKEVEPNFFKYSPANEDLARGVGLLSSAYKERRVKVIEAIFTKPLSGIREFAKAFKFRGGDDE